MYTSPTIMLISLVLEEDPRYCWKLFVSLKKVWWAEYEEEEESRQPALKQHYKGLISVRLSQSCFGSQQ